MSYVERIRDQLFALGHTRGDAAWQMADSEYTGRCAEQKVQAVVVAADISAICGGVPDVDDPSRDFRGCLRIDRLLRAWRYSREEDRDAAWARYDRERVLVGHPSCTEEEFVAGCPSSAWKGPDCDGAAP